MVEFVKIVGFGPVKQRKNRFNPDGIRATKISSRLIRRAIPKSSHLTGQVGQAG